MSADALLAYGFLGLSIAFAAAAVAVAVSEILRFRERRRAERELADREVARLNRIARQAMRRQSVVNLDGYRALKGRRRA